MRTIYSTTATSFVTSLIKPYQAPHNTCKHVQTRTVEHSTAPNPRWCDTLAGYRAHINTIDHYISTWSCLMLPRWSCPTSKTQSRARSFTFVARFYCISFLLVRHHHVQPQQFASYTLLHSARDHHVESASCHAYRRCTRTRCLLLWSQHTCTCTPHIHRSRDS